MLVLHIFPDNKTAESSSKLPHPVRVGSGTVHPTEQKQDNYVKLFEQVYSAKQKS